MFKLGGSKMASRRLYYVKLKQIIYGEMTSLFVFAVQRLEFSLVGCSFRIPSLVKPIYYCISNP